MDDQEELDTMFGSEDNECFNSVEETNIQLFSYVKHMPAIGGCRGVFAKTKLLAGCLISAEKPFIGWSKNTDFGDVDDLARIILQILKSERCLEPSRLLHPCTIQECDAIESSDIRTMFDVYDGNDLNTLAAAAEASIEEVIRVALALQHNGFHSGLYEKQSLLNHSCDPNCLKLTPSTSHSTSEIWTIRDVAEGEELTICYYSPMESATATVRSYLNINHRFWCNCTKCSKLGFTAVVTTIDDLASLDKEISDKLQAEVEFEQKLMQLEQEQQLQANTRCSSSALHSTYHDIKQLLLSAFVSATSQSHLLSPSLFARARKIELAAIVDIIQACEHSNNNSNNQSQLTADIAVAYLRCSIELYQQQALYLQPSHPDLGAALQDICEGIQSLKQHFPATLAAFDPELWGTILPVQRVNAEEPLVVSKNSNNAPLQCAKRCQAEAKRIKSLYSTPLRFPEAARLVAAPPGAFYWGGV